MVHAVALQLAEQQHGVVAREQLRRRGLSKGAIDAIARSEHWEALERGVLVRRGAPKSLYQRILVALLIADPHAVLSHDSALWVWTVRDRLVWPIHAVTTKKHLAGKQTEVTLHRVREVPTGWTTRRVGIPVVRPELAALHVFATLRPETAERVVDRMWANALLSGASLTALVAQLGERGRNGTAGLRRYLEPRGAGYVPPASGLESRLNEILESMGLEVRRQVELGGEANWGGRVDFLIVGANVVVEAQSERFHDSLTDRAADRRRRERLEAAGFTVVEVWDSMIFAAPAEVRALIRTALDRPQNLI